MPHDTNGYDDAFVHDISTGTTVRVSLSTNGNQANDHVGPPTISGNGRYVGFDTWASNLVPNDDNGWRDVFVHDLATGTTSVLSVSSEGVLGDSVSFYESQSYTGRFVAFGSLADNLVVGDTNLESDIYVRDRKARTTTRVSVSSRGDQADDVSFLPAISAGGRYVAFGSFASNLVPDDHNGAADIFVHDRKTGRTELVSVSTPGAQANESSTNAAISGDGRYVAFYSSASNLVANDTNGVDDVFVRDRLAGTTTRVSVSSDGAQGNDGSAVPAISANGRFLTFQSSATNLVEGDTNGWSDLFVRDLVLGVTTRVDLSSTGAESEQGGGGCSISADGRFVAFGSTSSNLVDGDTNGTSDAFVRGPLW